MILYSESIYNKSFTGDTMKQAYLKACKWLSTNVISKVELAQQTVYKIEKSTDTVPTVTITILVEISEEEIFERHCKICQEMSKSFFINEQTDCKWCKVRAFDKRLKKVLYNKKSYAKQMLLEQLGER